MDNRNFIVAIALSVGVLILWEAFYATPERQRMREAQLRQQAAQQTTQPSAAQTSGSQTPSAPNAAAPASGSPVSPIAPQAQTRDAALKLSPRIQIDTPALKGSIALKGARIDDVVLKNYKVELKSPENVVLLSPDGAPSPFYAHWGWVAQTGETVKLPNEQSEWLAETIGPLTDKNPLTLRFDNGEGVIFRNTIAVDDRYMFTFNQTVENKSGKPIQLSPYALISRYGTPKLEGFFIQHEGLLGVTGDSGLEEFDYSDLTGHEDYTNPAKRQRHEVFSNVTGGWTGITDKYWAAALIPEQTALVNMGFSAENKLNKPDFKASFAGQFLTVAPNATQTVTSRLFAGAKQVTAIDAYKEQFGVKHFEKLIDWGWFWFITQPMFYMLDFFFKLFGNFGVSILIVTVLLKLVFFPLANKSYASMSQLKKLQPDILRLRERYKDDKMRQQQEMMALYKREKVNPLSGCLPLLIQIPVFFALYKVLFIAIEMRHAPFFGWIQDLSAPDPTSIFNLFGLIPWDPGAVPVLGPFLMLGIWPLIMGVTMWVQMKLNPTPTDPIQAQVFTLMPILFTFMLASFPAGLVIYWAWNNILSIAQQWYIMERHGVKVELWDNMGFGGAKLAGASAGAAATPAPEPTRSPSPALARPAMAAKSDTAPAKKAPSKPNPNNGRPSGKPKARRKR
jgi:YidC/Oxa1 family membrane protein insertase